MSRCPQYIKSLYKELDKNTYVIQAHSSAPKLGTRELRLYDSPSSPIIKGINEVFFNIPENIFIVYGTPNRCSIFEDDAIDVNYITQLMKTGNELVLSQNPSNYQPGQTYRIFLESLGVYCSGDRFFNFAVSFDMDPHFFNISKIEKRGMLRAYNDDHSVNLGRKLKTIISNTRNNVNYYLLSTIVNEISNIAKNNPTIIYLTSCNIAPSQDDPAVTRRVGYSREYNDIADQIVEKGMSNIAYLRKHADLVSTRGSRLPSISSDRMPFSDEDDMTEWTAAKEEAAIATHYFKNTVRKVRRDFPFGWSDKGCPCIDRCKQKKEYSKLSHFCPDCDKYYCEVGESCPDEIIEYDGGKRFHHSVRKYLAKCPEKK